MVKPGLILGPLLAIHWVTMFESIELNSIAVGIGLVFSYPLFVLLLEFLRGNKPKSYQVFLISIGFTGLYFLLDISNINSLEGIFYGLISAISLSLIIIIGEKFSSQLGGLKVAFSQLLVASIILFKFTYESREWLVNNLAVSIFLGFFLTGVGLTTYWYVVKIIKPIAVSTISYLEPVTGVSASCCGWERCGVALQSCSVMAPMVCLLGALGALLGRSGGALGALSTSRSKIILAVSV